MQLIYGFISLSLYSNQNTIAMNMHNYNFILNNLDLLLVDVTIFNLSTIYPDRAKFGIIENQNLINLKRQILSDISENRHNLIYFTVTQWETIKEYIERPRGRFVDGGKGFES